MSHQHNIKCDLKSQIPYGTFSFPFSSFWDERSQYRYGQIGWHWHEELEFVCVLEGSVQCCVGEQRMDIHAGDGLFINQNTLHSFALTSGDRMVSLVFSPQFLAIPYANIYTAYIEPVLTSNLYVISLSSSVEQERAILQKIQYIAQIDHGESPTKELDTYIAVLELWRSFFITMFSGHSFTANQGFFQMQQRMKLMLDYIGQNYAQKITSNDIAECAHISKGEAVRCFNRLLHSSPIQYLNTYRIFQACRLLQRTDLSIAAVSEAVGFASNTYFSRLFRRQFHMTPMEMRKQQQTGREVVSDSQGTLAANSRPC